MEADCSLNKNLNASRPSEHPPVRGKNMSKRLGGIIGYKYKTSSWHLNGIPDGTVVILGQQYNTGEKPTVMLYTLLQSPCRDTIRQKQNKSIVST